jgi:hypothetical protein
MAGSLVCCRDILFLSRRHRCVSIHKRPIQGKQEEAQSTLGGPWQWSSIEG